MEELDALVDAFAMAMKAELRRAQIAHNYYDNRWKQGGWSIELREEVGKHLARNQPVATANYLMFAWLHHVRVNDLNLGGE